jgi:NAD(P)-dependent dehydrogenase (short-subunit alcohol dehydrogenase family)
MTLALKGRTAIITGASQGLGFEIAQAYVDAGASVLLCARDENNLATAVSHLMPRCSAGQNIVGVSADVSNESDVDRLVRAALENFGTVQILVNNAGIYGPKGTIEEIDWEDWKRAIEINLLGSVLMCRNMLRHFKQQRYGKIIQLSGGGATNPLPRISAYAASKAAIVRFAETLAEEVREWRVDVNSIAPGALNTRLLDEVLEAGPEKVGTQFYERALKQKDGGGSPIRRGAELAIFLASSASDGITGKLLSAIWDPWPHLAEHKNDLQQSDVYTLRRIVPKDRGMTWGDQT